MQKNQNYSNCGTNTSYLTELKRKAQLNNIITNKDGSPDYLAINIYFDTLRSWYAPKKYFSASSSAEQGGASKLKTKGIFLCYNKLSKNHGASKDTIRRKLVKLEQLGLIKRSFQHKNSVTTNSYNKLIIYVWKDTPHFFNKFGISFNDVTDLNPQTNHQYIAEKHNIKYSSNDNVYIDLETRRGILTCADTKELRINSKEFNYRSTKTYKKVSVKSNFNKTKTIKKENIEIITNKLSDYYPLTQKDCIELQINSGREFSLNAMNEILKSLINKFDKTKESRFFKSKQGFIAYMSKVFMYEKRDAVKISNETFRIKSNISLEEQEEKKAEEYLTNLEQSTLITKEVQLKKKLANILEKSRAYKLLTAFRSTAVKENKYNIKLSAGIDLTDLEKQQILQEIQSIYNDYSDEKIIEITELIIEKPEARIYNFTDRKQYKNIKQKDKKLSKKQSITTTEREKHKQTIWQELRGKLSKEYGKAIDEAWFSKLEAEENKVNKTLKIKAKSSFVQDWVQNNYMQKIEMFAANLGFRTNGYIC